MSSAKRKISDRDLLDEFEETDEPVLTAKEISDQVGMTRQAI